MSEPIVIVATITAEPEHRQVVEEALLRAVEQTRTEPGCERYDLHRDLADPCRFVMLEQWRDGQAIALHGKAPAFTALAHVLDGRAELSVSKLTQLI